MSTGESRWIIAGQGLAGTCLAWALWKRGVPFLLMDRGIGGSSRVAPSPWQDSALYVALAMGLFAMLFGTRRASLAEHNRGLVMAMAVTLVTTLHILEGGGEEPVVLGVDRAALAEVDDAVDDRILTNLATVGGVAGDQATTRALARDSAGPALLPLTAVAQSGLPDRAIRVWVGFSAGGTGAAFFFAPAGATLMPANCWMGPPMSSISLRPHWKTPPSVSSAEVNMLR